MKERRVRAPSHRPEKKMEGAAASFTPRNRSKHSRPTLAHVVLERVVEKAARPRVTSAWRGEEHRAAAPVPPRSPPPPLLATRPSFRGSCRAAGAPAGSETSSPGERGASRSSRASHFSNI